MLGWHDLRKSSTSGLRQARTKDGLGDRGGMWAVVGTEGALGTDREGLRPVKAKGGDGDEVENRDRRWVAVDAKATLGLDREVLTGSDARPRTEFCPLGPGRNDLMF